VNKPTILSLEVFDTVHQKEGYAFVK
jgi:hypothetical protein